MKVYLAARFSRRHECHALGKHLENFGHTIVSRWTLPNSDHVKKVGLSAQAQDSERERFAREDLEDIDNADWLICLMDEPRNDGRGGKHVEYGYALGKGIFVTSIGPKETVFHHLGDNYPTVEDFIKHGRFI